MKNIGDFYDTQVLTTNEDESLLLLVSFVIHACYPYKKAPNTRLLTLVPGSKYRIRNKKPRRKSGGDQTKTNCYFIIQYYLNRLKRIDILFVVVEDKHQ